MTPAEAEALAVKICQTWPKSPPVDVWVEDLLDLDVGAAGTGFVRLRREAEHAPSIARFRATVKSLRTTDGGTPRGPKCEACSNSGWVETDPLTIDDHTYSQVRPCTCPEGKLREQSTIWRERQLQVQLGSGA